MGRWAAMALAVMLVGAIGAGVVPPQWGSTPCWGRICSVASRKQEGLYMDNMTAPAGVGYRLPVGK